jgi:hypothetical protein
MRCEGAGAQRATLLLLLQGAGRAEHLYASLWALQIIHQLSMVVPLEPHALVHHHPRSRIISSFQDEMLKCVGKSTHAHCACVDAISAQAKKSRKSGCFENKSQSTVVQAARVHTLARLGRGTCISSISGALFMALRCIMRTPVITT